MAQRAPCRCPTPTGAAGAELHFHLLGVAYQLLSIVFESARITLVQLLIQRKGLRLNPITVRAAARPGGGRVGYRPYPTLSALRAPAAA